MQDNEVSLEQLKSVYKAHTEAYLDFNMALINILSNQKEIINKVESLKVLSDDEFKNLSKEYAVLEKLFENFQMTQTKRDADLEEATIEYTAQISNFGSDIEEMKTELKSMKKIYWDIRNNLSKVGWTLGGIITFLTALQLFTGKGIIQLFN
jgi:virulence-associated protein VapD